MRDMVDIAVIGAGPAGATFARLAGERFSVALIDKKSDGADSFHKPCGGLLSADAQKALSRFGLTLPKEILVDPQIFAVKTLDLRTKRIRHYQRFYINVDRHKFDRWLLSLVGEQVEVIEASCRDVTRTDDGFAITYACADGAVRTIRARCVVGADGANSLVRRTFFPRKTMRRYVAIQQWFAETHKDPFYSCVFDPDTSDCCSWSISKDHFFIFGGAFAPKDCRAHFEAQKQKLCAFGFQFGAPLKTEACVVLRPRSLSDFCVGGGNVFLLGEAAGFISPSSLEGISWAIDSASLLAEAFMQPASHRNRAYAALTRNLRFKLWCKIVKCPFMYQPQLRSLVMKSGIGSIHMIAGDDDAAAKRVMEESKG